MQHLNFLFQQSKKDNWSQIRDQFTKSLNDLFRRSSYGEVNNDFEIEIKELSKKRSGQQLKAFWVLIESVKRYMNAHGNNYTKDQIAEWFKIEAGHCDSIEGQRIGKSIANKSDCSKEQMEALITEILKFGAENDIKDCYIEDRELEELLKFYEN